jgi:hypothetical protein
MDLKTVVKCRSLCVTCKTGFELDDWIYLIHTPRDYRQYSDIAYLHLHLTFTHAIGFSDFTSRILATDLSQCHCNFKSHMKSSSHSLIPLLLSPELHQILDND